MSTMVRWITRHPVITILLVFGITLLLLIPASRFKIDSSVEGFFNSEDTDVKMVQNVRDKFGSQDLLTIVIDCSASNPEVAEAYIEDIVAELEKDERWKDIQYKKDLGYAGEYAILYLPEEYLFGLTDPDTAAEDIEEYYRLLLQQSQAPQYIVSDNGNLYLINAGMDVDLSDAEQREILLDDLGQFLNGTKDNNAAYRNLEVGFTGGLMVIDYEGDQAVYQDFFVTAVLTLLFILILLFLSFRSLSLPLLAAIPLLLGILWTVGVMFLLYDSLHMMSVMFAALILGLGIDYCIHALTRFKEEMEEHNDVEVAFVHTFSHTGKAIALGSVTTAVAFFSYYFGEAEGLHQLGVVGSVGLLLTLALVFMLLPALITIRLKFRKFRRGNGGFAFLGGLGRQVQRFAWILTVILVGLLVFFAIRIPGASLSDDLYANMPTELETYQQLEKVKENFDYNPDYLTCVVGSEAELANKLEAFQQQEEVAALESIGNYLPENQDTKLGIIVQAVGVHPELADIPWINVSGMTWEDLPESISRSWVSEGDFLIKITTKGNIYSKDYQTRVVDDLREIHPAVIADAMMYTKMLGTIARDMIRLSLCASAVLFFIVYAGIRKRNPVYALLAMVPMAFGILGLFATYKWFGIELTAFSICTIPLIIGIGIDNGIHIIHRYLEEGKGSLPDVVRHTGKAIFLTTATTCLAFSSFLFSSHPTMQDLALVPIIGLVLCFLAAILFLPALLRVFVDRKKRERWR